jgi:hypothetical protein
MSIKKILNRQHAEQAGQTLIETLAAIFMLTMGITAAVGLAIFALNSSTNVTSQIVGMGLAREGIEAVKNMRDSNWLKQASIDLDCYNYLDVTGPNSLDAKCYKDWRQKHFCIRPTGAGSCNGAGGVTSQNYYLFTDVLELYNSTVSYQPNSDHFLDLMRDNTNYGMQLDTTAAFHVYYRPNVTPCDTEPYCRSITIEEESIGQYNITSNNGSSAATVGPRLKVTSRVWWQGKKCPASSTYAGAGASCKIELVTYLTNWKNY